MGKRLFAEGVSAAPQPVIGRRSRRRRAPDNFRNPSNVRKSWKSRYSVSSNVRTIGVAPLDGGIHSRRVVHAQP